MMNRAIILGSHRLTKARPCIFTRQSTSVTTPPPPTGSTPPPPSGSHEHRTSKFDKWLLEHFKKYPKGQAPNFVTQQTMERIRSRGKIKLNLYFGVASIFAILYYIYQGKKERAAGYSLAKMNMDWHAEVNRKFREEQAKEEGRQS